VGFVDNLTGTRASATVGQKTFDYLPNKAQSPWIESTDRMHNLDQSTSRHENDVQILQVVERAALDQSYASMSSEADQ
jgi:predicted class III extradiol MEMO1 family dioxygenase